MSSLVTVSCSGGSLQAYGAIKSAKGRRVGLRICKSSSTTIDFPEDAEKKHQPQNLTISSKEKLVQDLVLKQEALVKERRKTNHKILGNNEINHSWDLDEAYDRCLRLAAIDLGSGSLGASPHPLLTWAVFSVFKLTISLLLNLEEQEQLAASAALYVWCRKTDELVDGNNGCGCTPEVLDRWEQRLINTYEGRPLDIYDAALSHTLSKYPIDLQLLKDLIQGARMDLSKTRYQDFDELYLYVYRNCGAPFLMFVQLTPAENKASLYNAALAYAALGQLTDFLRDVIEDARMGRVYLPQDELARAGLSEDDIYTGEYVSEKWRSFMKEQVNRARAYADEGDKYYNELLKDLIQGARMDLSKTRYQDFDELYLYVYRNCGAPFLMFVQLTPAENKASLYNAALAYAALGQLTDFLRDVIEDARMGRVYLPQDELARAGLSEDDIYTGEYVSEKWRSFMKEQVNRARAYADEGDKYFNDVGLVCRLCFSVLSLTNRHFLDRIEENDYDLSKPTPMKLLKLLPEIFTSCVRIIMEAKYFS